MMNIGVIIPAAGTSSRYGSKDKLAEDVGGRPLLLRTVEFFTKREDVQDIVVVAPEHSIDEFQERFGPALSFHGVKIVKGGATRSNSVANAIKSIEDSIDRLAVHDAARPALFDSLFDKLLLASKEFSAVAPALPLHGTIKKTRSQPTTIGDEDAIADAILGAGSQVTVDAFEVLETIDRTSLWELQTPQFFEPKLLRNAYEQDDIHACTDDAQVVEKLGETVHLIEGDSRNIKVTTPADYKLIRSILGVRGDFERPVHKRF